MIEQGLINILKDRCEHAVLLLLEGQRLSKKALFEELEIYFNTNSTPARDDDNVVRAHAGAVLSSLVARGEVKNEDGVYFIAPPDRIRTEKELFLEALVAAGGRNFEFYTVGLLRRYFAKNGKRVLHFDVPGGSDDGGIDGVITTVDELGFYENIMIQAKCRDSNEVTEKEVREFFGSLSIKKGTRGIYATTSTIHPAAHALLASIDNCVGIDGNKLFELAQSTSFGIKNGKADKKLLSNAKEAY